MSDNPFLNRLMDDEAGDVVHSSAYAKAQNGGTIGAASTESFTERQKIDNDRSYIKKYNDSRVVTDAYGNGREGAASRDATAIAKEMAKNATMEVERREFAATREKQQHIPKIERDVTRHEGETTRDSYLTKRKELADRFGMPDGRPEKPPARRNPGILR